MRLRHAGAGLVLLAAACGGGAGQSTAAPRGPLVQLKLLAFTPTQLTIKTGTTVTWRSAEDIGHTVTSGAVTGVDPKTGLRGGQHPDGRFDHRLGSSGSSFSYRFANPGTYSYFCSIHEGMNATVVVTA